MKDKNNKDCDKEAKEAVKKEPETVALPKSEYEALLKKLKDAEDLGDKHLRGIAEFENARKRIEKDKQDFLKYANEGFILELLPILDNLEIAEKHTKEAKDFNAVREGVDMIQTQIQNFLKDIGLTKIKTVGEKFDPHFHEAMEIDESSDKEDGTIVTELKSGYRLHEKLLRPAMVKIAKKKTENK